MIRHTLTLFLVVLVTASVVTAAEPTADEWQLRFNGKTLGGWSKIGGGDWEVVDGVIHGTSKRSEKRHGHLITNAKYSDFKLRVEYKAIAGNSGLYFRVDQTGGNVGVKGFQAEIDPNKDAGGLYETGGRGWVVKPSAEQVASWYKPDEWNTMTVTAQGKNVTVTVNGKTSAELVDDPGRQQGYIAVQLHGGQDMDVMFRRIEIVELGK